MKQKYLPMLISCLGGMATGCGNGSGSDPMVNGRTGGDETRLTLKVTDAPIDGINQAWIQFTAVEVKPEDGDALSFPLDTPQTINLLALTGNRSEVLLDNVVVPAGDYEWIKLKVNAEWDGILDSYVRLTDGSEPELRIPSGATSGLLLNRGFDAEAAVPLHLTIDFDLRKSIVVTGGGDYMMNPVLNLVEDKYTGTLNGIIGVSLLTGPSCSDADPATGNAIYVFSGGHATPDDISNSNNGPYTTTTLNYNVDTGHYEYEVGFLPEGDYTVAFTCAADDDHLSSNDNIDFVSVIYHVMVENNDNNVDEVFR